MRDVKESATRKPLPLWKQRLKTIARRFDTVYMPETGGKSEVSQDEEWCEVSVDGKRSRIRFHDYGSIYRVPGLYEEVFYQKLKCTSPSRVVRLLEEVLKDHDIAVSDLKVLDVGAGNGIVADELYSRQAKSLVGIDIIEEAKEAAYRDRPEVYDDYLVTDLADLNEADEKRLRKVKFNCLATVAALGFGDIPDKAFVKALDLVETPGWLAFNIKQDFLEDRDQTGFCRLIKDLSNRGVLEIQAYRRYRHRVSMTGEPLYYVAMVARKCSDVPDELLSGETEGEAEAVVA